MATATRRRTPPVNAALVRVERGGRAAWAGEADAYVSQRQDWVPTSSGARQNVQSWEIAVPALEMPVEDPEDIPYPYPTPPPPPEPSEGYPYEPPVSPPTPPAPVGDTYQDVLAHRFGYSPDIATPYFSWWTPGGSQYQTARSVGGLHWSLGTPDGLIDRTGMDRHGFAVDEMPVGTVPGKLHIDDGGTYFDGLANRCTSEWDPFAGVGVGDSAPWEYRHDTTKQTVWTPTTGPTYFHVFSGWVRRQTNNHDHVIFRGSGPYGYRCYLEKDSRDFVFDWGAPVYGGDPTALNGVRWDDAWPVEQDQWVHFTLVIYETGVAGPGSTVYDADHPAFPGLTVPKAAAPAGSGTRNARLFVNGVQYPVYGGSSSNPQSFEQGANYPTYVNPADGTYTVADRGTLALGDRGDAWRGSLDEFAVRVFRIENVYPPQHLSADETATVEAADPGPPYINWQPSEVDIGTPGLAGSFRALELAMVETDPEPAGFMAAAAGGEDPPTVPFEVRLGDRVFFAYLSDPADVISRVVQGIENRTDFGFYRLYSQG